MKSHSTDERRENGIISVGKFSGIRGIIGFRVKGLTDATGHFTLWDTSSLLYGGEDHDYFGIASEAALWKAGTIRVTTTPI